MSSMIFGPDPVRVAVQDVLNDLACGRPGRERLQVDLKEEAGRHDRHGRPMSGGPHNEAAARALAGEAACMANTPGGGALVVGVADGGELVGAELDAEWLRHRVYELTDRRLTVDVREAAVRGVRLLVLLAPQAIEPIRWHNKIMWRVDHHCVEVDASTWHGNQRLHQQFDWSAQPSNLPESAARDAAVGVVRRLLADSGEPAAVELAGAPTPELLRRLNAVTGDGRLTNAGALVLVGRPEPALDYLHRPAAGGDSDARVRRENRSVIEQLDEVFTIAQANNPVRHVGSGLAVGQVRRLPERAVREAIVNGVAHRQWSSTTPTVVEHIGDTLRVTSPGGFMPGITRDNIITHPSKSRNAALTQLLAALRVAEQQGIGVDRMFGDMLRLGLPIPDIDEHQGPQVVTTLVGQVARDSWMRWLRQFDDPIVLQDLRLLMIVDTLVLPGWVDLTRAARRLQVSVGEAQDSLNRMVGIRFDGHPALGEVAGTPAGSDPAYVLTRRVLDRLDDLDHQAGWRQERPDRKTVALDYAAARGRISTTELGGLVGASPTNVNGVLKSLADDGLLEPSRTNRRGPGFFYRYVEPV